VDVPGAAQYPRGRNLREVLKEPPRPGFLTRCMLVEDRAATPEQDDRQASDGRSPAPSEVGGCLNA
jgi:hypothetical protein